VGQNPQLPAATLRENVLLACPEASEAQLQPRWIKPGSASFLCCRRD
jgi:ABC-type transport system involved in cytochrome bd biosynthesis fused ATPase/permease subunit